MADVEEARQDPPCMQQVEQLTTPLTTALTPITKPQPRKSFNTLSTDLKILIVEHIVRPTDLRNVCLVSKQLHEIAVRFLYRSINLELGHARDMNLSAFLHPRNIGLEHIRKLDLHLAKDTESCGDQEAQAKFATRMILEFLPEDILEHFVWVHIQAHGHKLIVERRWSPWTKFGADNMLLLLQRQRRLKFAEVVSLDRCIIDEVFDKDCAKYETAFRHLTGLGIYPDDRPTLKLAGHYIERTADQLEELVICTDWTDSEGESTMDLRELNDTTTAPGLLSRSLFRHMLPFETCQPLSKLTSISLSEVNVRQAADVWCKVINFRQMTKIHLTSCSGVDSLIGQLSKSTNLPVSLKEFALQHTDNSESEALLAVDAFLCRISGIQILGLDLQKVSSLPQIDGILRQSKTLQILGVHASASVDGRSADGDELVYKAADFRKICQACRGLQELSCAWPSRSILSPASDTWNSFGSHVVGYLKELVTLHISTFPHVKPSKQALPRPIYDQLLQGLAQSLFEMARRPLGAHSATPGSVPLPPSIDPTDLLATLFGPSAGDIAASGEPPAAGPCRLRLVAFGNADRISEREDSENQLMYLRSTSIDAEGNEQVYATPIGWCARQFVEPRSQVLECVLLRETRIRGKPPVSDMDSYGFAFT